MKKLLSVILALSLLLGIAVFPTTAATAGETGAFDESALASQGLAYTAFTTANAKILGRTTQANPFSFKYPNTGVEFEFTGTTLGVVVTAQPRWCKSYCVIDGGEAIEFKPVAGEYVILATGLANTKHTAKIMSTHEAYDNPVTYGGVITDAGTTITKTADRPLKIQFIGDSITAAYNLSNGSLVYSYQTAEILNADMQSVASAGAHMYDVLLDDTTNSLTRIRFSQFNENVYYAPYFYGSIQPTYGVKGKFTVNEEDFTFSYAQGGSKNNYKPTNDYDYNSFVPDIIVINLGTNDINQMTQSRASSYWDDNKKGFIQTYVNFLTMLGQHYPNAKIVCSYGMMSANQDMFNFIQEAVDKYNALPEHAEAVTFKFSYRTDLTGVTNDTHPGVNSHKTAAEELSTFIKKTFALGEATYTADSNGKVTLPESNERTGYLFLGWYKENGEAFDLDSTLAPGSEITLTPNYISMDALSGYIDADGNENDDNPVPTTAKYKNGLYVQGAQVRTPLDEKSANSLGIRFVTVVSEDVLATLKSSNGITNVKYGTLVASSKVATTLEIEDGMKGVSAVYADKIWRNASTLGADYQKYTACIVKVPENQLSTTLIVRPFISYTDANGVERCLYGDVYSTASLFTVARAAYLSTKETQEVKDYLYENIISLATGDNDTTIPF